MKIFRYLAFLLALGAAPSTPASIVHSGSLDLTIPMTFEGLSLNLYTGTATLARPADFDSGPWVNFDFGGEDISNSPLFRPAVIAVDPVNPGGDQVQNVSSGTVVNNTLTFTPGENASSVVHLGKAPGQFTVKSSGYMAFVFKVFTGGPDYYGWLRVTPDNTGTGTALVHEYAYESTAATPITVGAIPEPSAAVLVFLTLPAFFRRVRRGGGTGHARP